MRQPVGTTLRSVEAAPRCLDEFDLVVDRHEFAIFGGDDDCEIVDLVAELRFLRRT